MCSLFSVLKENKVLAIILKQFIYKYLQKSKSVSESAVDDKEDQSDLQNIWQHGLYL